MECDYIWRGFLILKRSIGGITFDTETATLVYKFREFDRLRGEPEKFLELEDDLEELEETQALYQTNDGTFFLHLSMLEADITRISQVSSIFSAARRRFCYKNHEVVACMERWIWHTRWVNRNRGAFGSILTAA